MIQNLRSGYWHGSGCSQIVRLTPPGGLKNLDCPWSSFITIVQGAIAGVYLIDDSVFISVEDAGNWDGRRWASKVWNNSKGCIANFRNHSIQLSKAVCAIARPLYYHYGSIVLGLGLVSKLCLCTCTVYQDKAARAKVVVFDGILKLLFELLSRHVAAFKDAFMDVV